MIISLPSEKVIVAILAAALVTLVGVHLAIEFSKYLIAGDPLRPWGAAFNYRYEGRVLSWYAGFLLLVCALLVAVIAAGQRRLTRAGAQAPGPGWRSWAIFAAVFFLIAFDSSAGIHAALFVPFVALSAVLGLALIPFWRRLPPWPRWQFTLAGTLYVSGAMFVNVAGVLFNRLYGPIHLTHSMLVAFEAALEMIGLILFIYFLLRYLKTFVPVQLIVQRGAADGER